MNPVAIAAAIEEGAQLAIKILELIRAAQKGDVSAAEALRAMVDKDAAMKEAVDEIYAYGDKLFDTGGE